MDKEISRNLISVEEKDIPSQQFLAGEWEHMCPMQAMERGWRAAGSVVDMEVKQQDNKSNRKLNPGVQDRQVPDFKGLECQAMQLGFLFNFSKIDQFYLLQAEIF